ncbi:MAG: TIGR04348 family glycosyltransferase [Thermoanaerobaculia bacterium]|nr:TIGR04348 family glycosyltransferase [Thermoanaerobaculia bacterium]
MSRLLRIEIVVPGERSQRGNWITAERWREILVDLGHEVEVLGLETALTQSTDPDLLIALHARKTFDRIRSFHRSFPDRPLIVTLTGTDLYRDVEHSDDARLALGWATRLVVLQPKAFDDLPPELRVKARLIRQSSAPWLQHEAKSGEHFDVCVVGHLREVKDPFRAAKAARLLPDTSRIRICHAGGAMSLEMEQRALGEMVENPRYLWLGELSRARVKQLLARSHVMAHTSRLEGGANAMSEALVAGLPVISSRVAGSVGMLGDDHPAYFEVGDTEALTDLLRRCETDPNFLRVLAERSAALGPLYRREAEVAAWSELLSELCSDSS